MESRGSAEDERSSLIETFCGITSASSDEAVFFLESHNWLLDAAIHSYYENLHQDPEPQTLPQPGSQSRVRRRDQQEEEEEEDEDGGDDDDEDYVPETASPLRPNPAPSNATSRPSARSNPAMGSRAEEKPSRPSGGRPTIRTLADLNRPPGPGSDSDDSDGPVEYFTGGEKSGMLVRDPTKGNRDVDAIFEQARQMGAMQGPFEPHQQSSSSRSFTGTGRLLSGETVPSVPPPPENVVHNIYFWSNGFTVNDGPLRRFDDPENASFLESIRKSECPKELEPADTRASVNVNLVRREENFPEPVQRLAAFQGVGRTLGSGSSNSSVPEPAATASAATGAPSLAIGLSVDDSLPTTSIQLRLADGTRMVARFNTCHTIADVRAFIDASRPGAATTYQLQTVGFPPKQLNDASKTIEEAGLANSVVIQKL